MKKLLVVADTYYPKVDGILRFTEQFLKRTKNTFDTSLLVPKLGTKKLKEKTYFVEPSKLIKLSGYPNMKLSFKNLKIIKNAIKKTDIVFTQGPALISYLSMYYGKKYKKKVISYMHVIPWELFDKFLPTFINKILFYFIKKMAIFTYNRCDEIMVPYQDLLEEMRNGGIKTKTTIARLGVDIDLFTPPKEKESHKEKLGLNKHQKVIGYVGRISKEKNTEILLEAFKKLEDQEHLFLLMVGNGPKEQADRFRELKNCKVTCFVDNVQDYLKAVDVFVMPSLTETTSLACLEAMSTGLPVISTKVGFIKSYLVKDYNGLFFPKNNSSVLSMKIEKLIKDKDLRKKLGENARKTVAYSFSWERAINKIKRILLNYT
jgi:glycosyltransferase involved in cell wall biosynthesis